MRSDPLDIATAITTSRGTKRMHQNLAWAVRYNSRALPVAVGRIHGRTRILTAVLFCAMSVPSPASTSSSSGILEVMRRSKSIAPL